MASQEQPFPKTERHEDYNKTMKYKESSMHSAKTNSITKGSLNISDVGPRCRPPKLAAVAIRGALTLLSAVLLIAARPAQATEAVPHNFTGNPDGANPGSSLILHDGNFYGTTYSGGLGYGTVFELSSNGSGGWTETVLYSFCSEKSCADGQNPTYSNVIFDSEGNIYGTTYGGGANGFGTVFELSPSGESYTETVLHSFASSPDGANPVNGLVMDTAGNLYGVTYAGGAGPNGGNGTVFELSPSGSTWTEQVIANISATYAGLAIKGGNLYGVGYASVFELTPPGGAGLWNRFTLHSFVAADAATQGSNPNGTLVFDTSGNLYGTTYSGGKYGYGTVYKLTPGTAQNKPWTEKLLAAFETGNAYPLGGIVFDGEGNIYGTSTAGGNSKTTEGTVYELVYQSSTGTYKAKVLFTFSGENGNTPDSSLIFDSSGDLWGTTYQGGSDGYGTVFEVNPAAAATTTTLTSSVNPSTSGQAVTFTATVTPSPPNGEAVVVEPRGQSPMTGGVATFTTSTLAVGTTKVRAVYEGDLDFITSMSAWLSQVVDQ
jgi:uncharacterized repeat protein (TIGR03803 family)